MTNENAIKMLRECATIEYAQKIRNETSDDKTQYSPFMVLKSLEQALWCIDFVANEYKDKISDDCAEGIGYMLSVDTYLGHPIYLYATLYCLLRANANVYFIVDSPYKKTDNIFENVFIETFVNNYSRASVLKVIPTLIRLRYIAIENFIRENSDIQHYIEIGDFVNFGDEKIIKVIKKYGLRLHLPSAHYIIFNYANASASDSDKQLLESLGEKCWTGRVDYAGFESTDNKLESHDGIDTMSLFYNDLSLYESIKSLKGQMDKVLTIVFTDKSKAELSYPDEFYECCDVHFSNDFDDNILNYDFTQLV